MIPPVIASKLFVPTLRRGFVPRPRLSEILRHGAESRLTLFSAPAGFGKTTVLAEWLNEIDGKDRCVAWLSLDPSDSDPATFWTCVVVALQAAVSGLDPRLVEHLASSPLPIERVLTTVLNELAATPHDVWLILDDYHLVDGREVGNGMAFLLEHLPPRVHVAISTRVDPELPLSRWRVRGELVEVRAADLRFTSEETAEFFNGVQGLGLASEELLALNQRTEGWIAALQLAGLSLKGRTDIAGFIAGFDGDDRYVLDYLLEEVLAHQPEPVRNFLLHTAILDRLTGRLCDAVTCSKDGSGMLWALERANLFVVPLDGRREWYRYHRLFADVLRARLCIEESELVPLLNQRASLWCEGRGMVLEAVRYALTALDFDRAAHLMELVAPQIRRNRQDALFLGWLKELPESVIRRSPVLSVFQAFSFLASGKLDGVELRLQDAERAMTEARDGVASRWADTEEFQTLPATIAIYRASLAQARGDEVRTVEYAQHALGLAGPGDHLARGAASGFLGLAAWSRGDVSTALTTFAQAVASLHAADNIVDELGSTVVLADLWLAAGRPSTARRIMLDALKMARARGASVNRAAAELHVGLSEVDCEAGDLSGARQHLEAAAELQEHAPLNESRYRWFVASGLLARAEGNLESALEFLEQAEPIYRRGFYPEVRPIPAMKARVWIAQGRLLDAGDWAHERGLSVTDNPSYSSEFDHLTLVRLLIARHRAHPGSGAAGQAAALLERSLDAAMDSGRATSLLEIRILQALAHDVQGHSAQACEALGQALAEVPEPDGYVRLFLNEGAPMTALLCHAAQNPARYGADDGAAGEQLNRLLRLGKSVQARDTGSVQCQGPTSRAGVLSERELQVLRLLGGEMSGPEIAGELFISYNTLRTHTKHIFTKLEVSDRRAAVRRARERGLL